MFRLIKLAVYAVIGYALYEFFRGLTETAERELASQQGGPGARQGQPLGGQRETQPGETGSARAGNMQFSGPGEGQRVQSEETSGEGVPHIVGRGVVQR